VRPELPEALDRVVLRGLERDRERRWPDLEAFRQALLALRPAPLTFASLGARLAGVLVDFLLFWLVALGMVQLALGGEWSAPRGARAVVVGRSFSLILFFLYLMVLEKVWGCSLGKWLFRLRVGTVAGSDPPGWRPAALRTLLFCGLSQLGFLASGFGLLSQAGEDLDRGEWGGTVFHTDLLLGWTWFAVGSLLVLCTMRPGNGYRGLHEVASGTRVYRLFRPEPRRALFDTGGWLLYFLGGRRIKQGGLTPGKLPERIAGFTIRGALKWTDGEKIVLGEDASVGRKVFIWLRPASAPPLDRARRDVGRRTRLRWLACGKQGDQQWDAILAPSGCPLPELVQSEGQLPWPELRPLLESLTAELTAACADGTLPRSLDAAQVWVQPDGRAQLADTALTEETSGAAGAGEGTDQERALRLLRQVVTLALEGRPPDAVNRLLAGQPPCATVQEFQGDLAG
jgi:hypothetical protein